MVDVTHSTGRKDIMLPTAKAALAVGADGVMAEVHPKVRYFACVITSFSGCFSSFLTLKVNLMASPHTKDPWKPSPSGFSISPMCAFLLLFNWKI
jgi:hypothetical protein